MIKDVTINQLKIIDLEEGRVFHALKKIDSGYKGFGEAYFSEIGPKKIKAWKRHKEMTLNLIVPIGQIRFILFDDRNLKKQTFQEVVLAKNSYKRLTIPPMIWFGFQGLSESTSLLLNIADIVHDPAEVDRKHLDGIDFDWSSK